MRRNGLHRYEEIEAFLISEAAAGRIPVAHDVARHFGVSRQYVHELRSKLITAGKLPHSPRGRGGLGDPGARLSLDLDRTIRNATIDTLREATSPLTAAMRDTIASELSLVDPNARAMTADERRVFYSELARRTHRQEIKVSALAALDRLEARTRTDARVGPPDPLTEAEAHARIAELQAATLEIFGPPKPA